MTTMRQTIYAALKRIQVTAAGEVPTSEEATDALERFNNMMHGLKIEGINLDWRTLTLDDDIPLLPEYIRGVEAMLALELAPEYGKEVDPAIAVIAERSRTLFQGVWNEVPDAVHDRGIQDRNSEFDFDITRG